MRNKKEFQTILLLLEIPIAKVILHRPEVHNAFNDVMINELLETFHHITDNKDIRLVILTGEGKSFCAGADLNWMRRVKDYTFEENLKESLNLAELFYTIYSLPKPTIARVNGAAIGGGTGFVAVCDMAIAASNAQFSFSEVKIGVVPACISPYVIRRIGEGRCREFFLTGERLSAEKALEAGLINQVIPLEKLDESVNEMVNQLLSSGPEALATCKELLKKVPAMNFEEVKKYTAEVIAGLRMSDEGQEGMTAFLEKRKPKWCE
ncbi:MAG: enoyl-CoA hydratase/isomerase family protein [Candidatus Edwardsbacteria bacterium]